MTYKRVSATVFVSVLLGMFFAGAGAARAADATDAQSINNATTADVAVHQSDVSVEHQESSVVGPSLGDDSNSGQTGTLINHDKDNIAPKDGTNPDASAGTDSKAMPADNGVVSDQNNQVQGQNSGTVAPPTSSDPPTGARLSSQPTLKVATFRLIAPSAPMATSDAINVDHVQTPPSPAAPRTPQLPTGAMDQINLALKSVVLPVSLRLNLPLLLSFGATNKPSSSSTFIVLVLAALIAGSYVGLLRRSGFQHAARSDVPRLANSLLFFATHQNVSLARTAALSAEGSRFNGVKNTSLNYFYKKGGE